MSIFNCPTCGQPNIFRNPDCPACLERARPVTAEETFAIVHPWRARWRQVRKLVTRPKP